MDPKRTYDYLELARQRVLDRVRPLSEEQYGRSFPIGLGTLARTLTHIMICEWYYIERMQQRPVPPYAQWPIQDEKPPAFAVLEEEWSRQAQRTRATISAVRDWFATIEYDVIDDDGREMIVTSSANDLFTQLALHEVHHRAQALNMLRQLGVTCSSDLDFNALMHKRREVAG